MIYILPVITAIVCAASFWLLLRDIEDHKELFFPGNEEVEGKKPLTIPAIIYCILLVLITIAASFLFCTLYRENGVLTNLKRLVLLGVMWPIAYIDFRTYRIPNSFLLLGGGCRILIFIFELIFDGQFVWMNLLSEAISAGALLLASVLCGLFIKNSIGFGDIKLFILMGFMLGLNGIWGAMFLALIVSFFLAVFLLVTKKKTRKDAIPFGPAIVIGTYLSVCLTGM